MTPVKFVFVYARKFDALFVFDEECTQANDGMLCCVVTKSLLMLITQT